MDTLIAKAKKIKLLILDIDGVLTDGRLYFSNHEDFAITFHIQDGLGINLLHRAGIEVAFMSGRQSQAVLTRAQELNIKYLYLGCKNKQIAYTELRDKLKLSDEQIAYVGDDWIDIPPLEMAGLKFTVPNAVAEVKAIVDWCSPRAGGEGGVRDICDFILKAQGKFDDLLKEFSVKKL
jgi:3-deoxy-D-manno-octulosonate 8-phosphate phosphatase (KDO 8-P phosphatase)